MPLRGSQGFPAFARLLMDGARGLANMRRPPSPRSSHFAPLLCGYISGCLVLCAVCVLASVEATNAPSYLSMLLVVCCSTVGQLAVLNLLIGVVVVLVRAIQWLIFGRLRIAEWQRVWERLMHYAMGQLVILGAVVEPDWAELVLWTSFAVLNGALALYSGLCRDRLE